MKLLQKENNVKGVNLKYPLTLQGYYESKIYKNQEELIEAVWDEYQEREQSKKESESKVENKISDVCWYLGLQDTICLADERTIDLLRKFQFYKYSPHLIDNPVWYEAYLILDKFETRIF